VTAAAQSAQFAPDTDFRVSITNAPGADAYPIASFTWLLIKPTNPDATKSKQINDFIKWMLSPDAQRMAADLQYAPLPVPLIELIQKRVGG
jgi:phosphate transport system substrate-binding protein